MIKWDFKYWCSCDSETGYVYQLESYQRRKEKRELNLGSSVVPDLFQVLKDTFCYVLFDYFFNSSTLIQKLHDNGLYGLDTACFDRTNRPQIKNKEMKQDDYQCKFYNLIACINVKTTSSWCYLESIWKK